jgi:hypothetical protein
MATLKTKGNTKSTKISFGKKKVGKLKKHYGPKEQRPKSYRGQGR